MSTVNCNSEPQVPTEVNISECHNKFHRIRISLWYFMLSYSLSRCVAGQLISQFISLSFSLLFSPLSCSKVLHSKNLTEFFNNQGDMIMQTP